MRSHSYVLPTAGASLSVYERDFAKLARLASAVTGDLDLGQEAVQEAFALAVRHRAEFRGDGTLEGWLWRTLTRVALKLRREAARSVAAADPTAEPAANGRSAQEDVRALIAGLSERQRLVLFLRYYADLDYRSIGEVLDVTPGTVGATLNTTHAAMRGQSVPARSSIRSTAWSGFQPAR
jgi:RNA polymerase sigma-70 factor, ECF subfamily